MSRIGLKCLAAGLLLAASSCSSAAFRPTEAIVHRPLRNVSYMPEKQYIQLDVALTPLTDPRITLPDGRVTTPSLAELEAYQLWLSSGQRADQRFVDFIAFSGCCRYAWWDRGSGIRLELPPSADPVMLAARWVRSYPDVVAEVYSKAPCGDQDPLGLRRVDSVGLSNTPSYSVYHAYDAADCSGFPLPGQPQALCVHGRSDCAQCGFGSYYHAGHPGCNPPLVLRPPPSQPQKPAEVGQPLGPLARP